MVKLKRGISVMILSLIIFVFPVMLYHSFVELSHFHASLSTSSILDLFPDEPHIPSIVALDPPIDFSVQPLDIFYASPRSPFNEQVEDEQIEATQP